MKQRYEILYKNNEYLQEYIGRELWLDQVDGKNVINGKVLNHSRTYTDIMHRILKEHWKHSELPVSPHKVLLWSTDKNCKITSLSASHLIYDRKKKIVFSDLLNQNFGNFVAHFWYLGATSIYVAPNSSNVSKNMNADAMGSTGVAMKYRVGIGTRAGNLRTVFDIQTICATAPENNFLTVTSDGAFNTTSGLVSSGYSFSAGGTQTLTEVGTYRNFQDTIPASFDFIWAYDIVSFGTIPAQVVNISSSIQL